MILFPGRHLMGVLKWHQLTPPNKMVELKTHELWCQYNGCTHRVNSNGSGQENYSSRQTLYVLTLIGKQTYIYLLTLNKKWKMKIMGTVAWLILLVVVSLCVVFCVLCFLQNNLVFSSVTKSHILKNENYELYFLVGFFVNQTTTGKITTGKKRYSRLAVGWNKSQIIICCAKIQTPTITGKITTGKKGTVVWPMVGINLR